jgi:ATP-dependent Clp protease ATP-binding subunit ClpX
MTKIQKHFGITFPADFPIKGENAHKLAKQFLLNPEISAIDAKNMLFNSKMIGALEHLVSSFDCDIDEELHIGIYDVEMTFSNKLAEWKDVFEMPTLSEIGEIIDNAHPFVRDAVMKTFGQAYSKSFNSHTQISKVLFDSVYGQKEAVETAATIAYELINTVYDNKNNYKISPTLFFGNSGTGKSHLIEKMCSNFLIPVLKIDCSTLTPKDFGGESIYSKVQGFAEKFKQDKLYGIVQFEYFDSLASNSPKNQTDYKQFVQYEILQFLDDYILNFNYKDSKSNEVKTIVLDSKCFAPIFTGVFPNINEYIYERLEEQEQNIRLIDKSGIYAYCNSEDLINYGFIPELANRITNICSFSALTAENLYHILTKPNNKILANHIAKAQQYGIRLDFKDDALVVISNLSANKATGIYAADSLLINLLKPIYVNPEKYMGETFAICADFVNNFVNQIKYKLVFKDFAAGLSQTAISNKFKLTEDEVMDLYIMWKKM